MDNQISSMKVLKNEKLNCNQNCLILDTYEIKIPESFGQHWYDKRLINKQILLVFKNKTLMQGDGYSINLINGPNINVTEKGIVFSDLYMLNEFIF